MTPAEELVCAIIRGDATALPLSDDDSLQQVVEAAFHHNLHLILFDILKKSSTWSCLPREDLENAAVTASTLDLIAEQELRKVLIRLHEHGIQPLLLKGVPLAYTLYQSPTLRPRADTDLLIRESELQPVARILTGLGYEGPDFQTDKLTSYECLYRRKSIGTDHNLDVHWKINNAQLFAKTFTFDELSAEAIEIPSLASCALGLGYTHALLLACMHRFAHAHAPFYVDGNPVYAGDHLRWVYDIHLLCSALNSEQWSEFTILARTKSIAAFCVDGLKAARDAFNTQIPAGTISALQTAARDEAASAKRLRASGAAWLFANLRALPNLYQRIALIRQMALPPSAYMMEKYRTNNRLMLPFLYGHRSLNGIFQLIKRSKLPERKKATLVFRAMRKLWRLATVRHYRNTMWLYWLQPKGVFQPLNYTSEDRYPKIFRFVQNEIGADNDANILSYGCSIGDEVFSLRNYFPRAVIKGIDVNRGNIALCRKRLNRAADAAISFEAASSTVSERAETYDAIFCMAVLRHSSLDLPDVTRCDHLIRFEEFAQTIEDFKRCLKPGGLLIIRHSNFRLCDAPAAKDFEAILSVKASKKTPIFDPDNLLMKDMDYPDCAFRKKIKRGTPEAA